MSGSGGGCENSDSGRRAADNPQSASIARLASTGGGAAADAADAARFRPNLLVDGPGAAAFAEDAWRSVRIGGHAFHIAGALLLVTCVKVLGPTPALKGCIAAPARPA